MREDPRTGGIIHSVRSVGGGAGVPFPSRNSARRTCSLDTETR